MTIQWNKVTWYSKLLAVVVFIATFWIAFSFGVQYEKVKVAETEPTSTITSATSGNLILTVGQTKTFGDTKVTLNSVPNDSRCPIDVACIWAGTVSLNVSTVSAVGTITKNIASEETQKFGNYEISVLEILPAPISKQPIGQKDYKITFHIEKIK